MKLLIKMEKNDNDFEQRKKEKAEKIKEVTDVLYKAVALKTNLKKQYENLIKKVNFDENTIINCLINAGNEDFKKIKEGMLTEENEENKQVNKQNQSELEDYN